MITLNYSGNNPKLSNAVNKANEILCTEAFYEKIAALPEYDPKASLEIAANLKKANHEIIIVAYRNPFGKKATKAINPFRFKVNTSKLSSVVAFAVHTLIRQTILSFSFANQKSRIEKIDHQGRHRTESLPSQIGEIAEIISRKARQFA